MKALLTFSNINTGIKNKHQNTALGDANYLKHASVVEVCQKHFHRCSTRDSALNSYKSQSSGFWNQTSFDEEAEAGEMVKDETAQESNGEMLIEGDTISGNITVMATSTVKDGMYILLLWE